MKTCLCMGVILLHKRRLSEQPNVENSRWKSAATPDSHHLPKSLSESLSACLSLRFCRSVFSWGSSEALSPALELLGAMFFIKPPFSVIRWSSPALVTAPLQQPLPGGSDMTEFCVSDAQESMNTEERGCVWPGATARKAAYHNGYSKCSQAP